MPIEHHNAQDLPPLKIEKPPLIPVDTLMAVNRICLAAGDVPPGLLRHFYEHVVGLKFVERDAERMIFAHGIRQIALERSVHGPGMMGLLIKSFDESLMRLRDASIAYEVLHTDSGLTRVALLRDPAGNWLQLTETRAF